MIRKIVTYFLIVFGVCCFGALIWFCELLYRQGDGKFICNSIEVTILDSTENRLITPASIREMICRIENPVGVPASAINLHGIENGITGMGAISKAEIAVDRNGRMMVKVKQRHPILRYQNDKKGYYIDDTGFCLPLSDLFASDVPVVTGQIRENDEEWKARLVELGNFFDRDPFWHTQIEQIDVAPDGNLKLFSRTSDQTVVFGQPVNIESKLSRLFTYYKNIAPVYGWDRYSDVDLRFSRQIVCTRTAKGDSLRLWENTLQQ